MTVPLGTGVDMRRETTFVLQNIDGDGVPTLSGDFVALVECPEDMSRITKWSFPDHKLIREEMNYRVAALVNTKRVKITRVSSVLVHKAGRKPPTPRRTLLVIDCEIDGVRMRVIIGHAINSAWAPFWLPTTYRKGRRLKWEQWYRHVVQEVDEGHEDGRVVLLLADANRSRGKWGVRRLVREISHGPDVVFVTEVHPNNPMVLHHKFGPKTGNGRVTHASIKFTLSLWKPGPR